MGWKAPELLITALHDQYRRGAFSVTWIEPDARMPPAQLVAGAAHRGLCVYAQHDPARNAQPCFLSGTKT
jgi:hypothetical protein